uniref:Uncharacterized protein n=1 Tax=Anas platyrhynchos platyrhynchos TaxID=8840 RepID=A0A493T8V0_ANAPP
MLALTGGCEEPSPTLAPRALFRSDSGEGLRGERLLQDAIREGAFFGWGGTPQPRSPPGTPPHPPRPSSPLSVPADGDAGNFNGAPEFCRADSDAGQRVSAGGEGGGHILGVGGCPQAVVSQQDTLLELRLQEGAERREKAPVAPVTPVVAPAVAPVAPGERPSSELALLQRQHALLQEELARCRQLCHERAQEAAGLEGRLRGSEQERARLERERDEAQRQLAAVLRQEGGGGTRGRRGTDPRRRSLPAGDACTPLEVREGTF